MTHTGFSFHASALAQALLLTLLMTLSGSALAEAPDLAQMFANFNESSVALINLVRGAAFVVGLLVTGVGLMHFKQISEDRGGKATLQSALIITAVGAALVAIPGSINSVTETMSLGTNTGTQLLAEPAVSTMPGLNVAIKGVLLFVKLVGHIAFFRGLLLFKQIGEGTGSRVGMGGALVHLVGGAFAININMTIGILAATFAPGIDTGGLGG